MPTYLDYKTNTLPETMPDNYYGKAQVVGVEKAMESQASDEEAV